MWRPREDQAVTLWQQRADEPSLLLCTAGSSHGRPRVESVLLASDPLQEADPLTCRARCQACRQLLGCRRPRDCDSCEKS